MLESRKLRLLSKFGTLRQIEIFLMVAELGSIARAAEALCLAQPSVSIQIKKLADTVGLPLYEFVGNKFTLTHAGREVQTTGLELVQVVNRLGDSLNDLKGLQAGALSISVVTTAQYFIPYVLAPFCKLYPGVEVALHTGNRDVIVQRLKDNLDDFYFFSELPKDVELNSAPFLPNPIAVVASKQHPLAGRTGLTWEDIQDQRFILREPGSGAMAKVHHYLQEQQFTMRDVMIIQSNEAIKHAVMANMGISILSAYILSNADTDGLTQLDVSGFPIMSQWKVTHSKDKKLSPVAQRFLDFLLVSGRDALPMKKIEKNVRSAMLGKWGNIDKHKFNA